MTRTRLAPSVLSVLLSALAAGCAEAPPPAAVAPAGMAGPVAAGQPTIQSASADAPAMQQAVLMGAPSVMPASPPPPPPAPMTASSPPPRVAMAKSASSDPGPAGRPATRPSRSAAPAAVAADDRAWKDAPAKRDVRDGEAAPAPSAAVAVQPEASVKAGEWDDNANYREFQRWIGTEGGQPFHRVDVRDRQFLVVRDADGRAVPRCVVSVIDERGRKVELTTTASGRALLFPHAEGLSGTELQAATLCQNGAASARFSLSQSDGVVDLKLAVKRVLPQTRDVDVAFILDTTGSMGEEIAAVKSTLQKVASALSGAQVRVHIGLVEYKDRTDPFVTRVYPMTTDVAAFSRTVAGLDAGGGGDVPESVNEGLHVGLTGLKWSDNAVAHLAFLIGDAPPHLDYPNDFDYATDMKTAAHKGIQIFTVAASGMDDLGQVVWRQVAQYTGATNLFVLRGGAGPQSTGAGDPKSSCGGTQTQYASGNLDALILQKVTRELRGLDRDPLRIAGLRQDESAKPCAERLMVAE